MLRGLHKLCDKSNWNEALSILSNPSTARPYATEKGGWGGWTPLHLAVKRDPPLEVVLSLIETAPETACIPDMYARHPLHYAAEWGASVEVLAALYDAHPHSVNAVDNDGRTPLHLAILGSNRESQQRRAPPTLLEVELLLDGEGVAATVDNEGNLPLHCACDNIDGFGDVEVLEALVRAFPPALVTRNSEGQTPLHLALLKSVEMPPSLEIIKILLHNPCEGQPSPVTMEDCDGRLALHCACKNFASFEVLHELLIHYREAASNRAEDGTYPLDILEEMRHHITSQEELEELNYKSDLIFSHCPDIIPYRKEGDRLERLEDLIVFEAQHDKSLSTVARFVWIWLCTYVSKEEREGYCDSVRHIVHKIKDADVIRALALIETSEGVPIREAATTKCSEMLQPYFRFADRYEFMEDEDLKKPLHVSKKGGGIIVRARDFSGVEDGGKPKAVAIRFESSHMKFSREIAMYNALGRNVAGIMPILQEFDTNRIGTKDALIDDEKFARGVKQSAENSPYDLTPYSCAFVLPLGDWTMDEITRHDRLGSGVDVQDTMVGIGVTLQNMHEKFVMHGSINPTNLLRISNVLTLTSLDKCAIIGQDYVGGMSIAHTGNLNTSLVPPEMIAKLTHPAQVKEFYRYYKCVKDDSDTYHRLTNIMGHEEIGLLGLKINEYLPATTRANFIDLWDRITDNNELWKKIKPRRAPISPIRDTSPSSDDNSIADEVFAPFYVIKSYHVDHKTGHPHQTHRLPYAPIMACPSHDIWAFGLLLFQLSSGSTLFQTSSSLDLVNSEDFMRIAECSESWVGKRIANAGIADALVRDLLKRILTKENRITGMEEVLSHPLFNDNEQERDIARHRAVLMEEAGERRDLKTRRKEKERGDWIHGVTNKIQNMISTDTILKFYRSTSSQWKTLCDGDGANTVVDDNFLLPTSFVLLPYELGRDGTATDADAAKEFAIRIAETLHFTSLAAKINQGRDENEPSRDLLDMKVKEYVDLLATADQKRDNSHSIVSLCEWIVSRATHSEKILADILSHYLPAGGSSPVAASRVAKKLIDTIVSQFVSLQYCQSIISKATQAEKAFGILIEDIVLDAADTARNIVNDKLTALVDSDFINNLEDCRPDLEAALFDFVEAFGGDAVLTSRRITRGKVEDLIESYSRDGEERIYMYLVDEYTGLPVMKEGGFVEIDGDMMRRMLPSMRLTAKGMCSIDLTQGLKNLTGLREEEDLSVFWEEITRDTTVGDFDEGSSKVEFNVFQEIFHGQGESIGDKELLRYEKYLGQIIAGKYYAGMKRTVSPDGKNVLWTFESSVELMRECLNSTVDDYIRSKATVSAIKSEENVINETSADPKDKIDGAGKNDQPVKKLISLGVNESRENSANAVEVSSERSTTTTEAGSIYEGSAPGSPRMSLSDRRNASRLSVHEKGPMSPPVFGSANRGINTAHNNHSGDHPHLLSPMQKTPGLPPVPSVTSRGNNHYNTSRGGPSASHTSPNKISHEEQNIQSESPANEMPPSPEIAMNLQEVQKDSSWDASTISMSVQPDPEPSASPFKPGHAGRSGSGGPPPSVYRRHEAGPKAPPRGGRNEFRAPGNTGSWSDRLNSNSNSNSKARFSLGDIPDAGMTATDDSSTIATETHFAPLPNVVVDVVPDGGVSPSAYDFGNPGDGRVSPDHSRGGSVRSYNPPSPDAARSAVAPKRTARSGLVASRTSVFERPGSNRPPVTINQRSPRSYGQSRYQQ